MRSYLIQKKIIACVHNSIASFPYSERITAKRERVLLKQKVNPVFIYVSKVSFLLKIG